MGGNPLVRTDELGLFFDSEAAAAAAASATAAAKTAAVTVSTACMAAMATGAALLAYPSGMIGGPQCHSSELQCLNDDDECGEIQAKINARVTELKVRYMQALVDKDHLYRDKRTGQHSWFGHKEQYEMKQVNLQRLIAEAVAKGCPYNPEADKWVKEPFPSAPVTRNNPPK